METFRTFEVRYGKSKQFDTLVRLTYHVELKAILIHGTASKYETVFIPSFVIKDLGEDIARLEKGGNDFILLQETTPKNTTHLKVIK